MNRNVLAQRKWQHLFLKKKKKNSPWKLLIACEMQCGTGVLLRVGPGWIMEDTNRSALLVACGCHADAQYGRFVVLLLLSLPKRYWGSSLKSSEGPFFTRSPNGRALLQAVVRANHCSILLQISPSPQLPWKFSQNYQAQEINALAFSVTWL